MQKITQLVAILRIRELCLALLFIPVFSVPLMAMPGDPGQPIREANSEREGSPTPVNGDNGELWGEKEHPEGFVRSKSPVKDGPAYNWIQMGYASLIMLAMLGFIAWLVRANRREEV